MRLWRLTRRPHVALDGAGALRAGTRYTPPGLAVASLASEAGLAVLVALRYLPADPAAIPGDYVLGWTEVAATPETVPEDADEAAVATFLADWLAVRRSLLCAVRSRVLPEADVVYLNPAHPAAADVAPLTCRPFSFAECLHRPPGA
jgi:RES domain-containing protein